MTMIIIIMIIIIMIIMMIIIREKRMHRKTAAFTFVHLSSVHCNCNDTCHTILKKISYACYFISVHKMHCVPS